MIVTIIIVIVIIHFVFIDAFNIMSIINEFLFI